MNIAFNIERVNYGGGERVMFLLMEEFRKRGESISCFTWNLELNGTDLDYPLHILKSFDGLNKISKYISRFRNLKDFLETEKIDWMITFSPDILLFHAAKSAKIKSLYSLRVDKSQISDGFINKLKQRIIFSLVTGIVFQTDRIKNSYPEYLEKSIVIPNPILDELPEPAEIREKKIVSVGRLSEEKGFPILLNAFKAVEDKSGYQLYIYGDGRQKDYLENLTFQLKIEKAVKFMGRVDRVVEHIADAEIFVLSSYSEGMPNALIEAMAMKLACISTNFPSGAAEFLITNNINGIIVPTGDTISLAGEMQRLINDDILRKNIQTQAVAIRKTLEKSNITGKWLEFMKRFDENNSTY